MDKKYGNFDTIDKLDLPLEPTAEYDLEKVFGKRKCKSGYLKTEGIAPRDKGIAI